MDVDPGWVVAAITVAGTIVVAIVGKLLSRRQDKAAGDLSTAGAAEAISRASTVLLEPLEKRIAELMVDLSEARREATGLREELSQARKEAMEEAQRLRQAMLSAHAEAAGLRRELSAARDETATVRRDLAEARADRDRAHMLLRIHGIEAN